MSSFEQKPGTSVVVATTSTPTPQGPSVTAGNSNYRLPMDITFQHASKLAIVEDKPILLD